MYLNKVHADYGYNHGTRKSKFKSTFQVEKQIRLNDRILSKYFIADGQKEVVCLPLNLAADGFRAEYFCGQHSKEGTHYFLSYSFLYTLTEKSGLKLIKILKQ